MHHDACLETTETGRHCGGQIAGVLALSGDQLAKKYIPNVVGWINAKSHIVSDVHSLAHNTACRAA